MTDRIDRASRTLAASPEAVYAAIVDPAALVLWLPPKGMTGDILEFDPRPGGAWRLRLTYEDATGAPGKTSQDTDEAGGRFVELIPGRKVVQTGDFVSDDPAFAGTMTMTWDIEPAPQGAGVAVSARGVPPGVSQEDHEAGIASSLENLAAFLE